MDDAMTLGQLGERLRQQRKATGKSLKDIADATGLSVGFISQIERNLAIPSLSSLATVADVLGVTIGELTGRRGAAEPDTYHDKREAYSLPDGQVRYERLSTVFAGSVLHSVKFAMPIGYQSETVSHQGEEFVYVLKGRIRYRVADQTYLLNESDSLHFDAKIPHSIEALSSDQGFAEVIWTGTLDIFDGEVHGANNSVDALSLTGTEFHGLTQVSG
jgi:transcriptional regulator with XRE-family HTH domain